MSIDDMIITAMVAVLLVYFGTCIGLAVTAPMPATSTPTPLEIQQEGSPTGKIGENP
jgi:hypothetical protein